MRNASFFLLLSVAPACAQYIPPDRFLEDYSYAIGYWENKGQVIDTDGALAKDVKFYSEGSVPRAYLRSKSRVSFVLADVDTSIATVDTMYRLDMRPFGVNAREIDPVGIVQKDWHQNFYLPHCGPTGVTNVKGYSRVTYSEIFPEIDLHFYSGSMGQKLAFVLRPGCSPADLRLAFSGQDSLKVDLWGNLKVYQNGKYFDMPFAMAYQVGTNGQVIPINWIATYDVSNNVVGFDYSSYNASLPLVFLIGLPPNGGPELVDPIWTGIDQV